MYRLRRDIPRFGGAIAAAIVCVLAVWNGVSLPVVIGRALVAFFVGALAAFLAGRAFMHAVESLEAASVSASQESGASKSPEAPSSSRTSAPSSASSRSSVSSSSSASPASPAGGAPSVESRAA